MLRWTVFVEVINNCCLSVGPIGLSISAPSALYCNLLIWSHDIIKLIICVNIKFIDMMASCSWSPTGSNIILCRVVWM